MNFKLKYSRVGSAFIIPLLLLSLYIIFNFMLRKTLPRQNNLQKYMLHTKLSTNKTIVAFKLRKQLKKLNIKSKMLNLGSLRPIADDTTVVVIQVHKDIMRMQYLITSLALVQNIHTTVLIFSHSYYDDHLNQLILSIDFAKVIQIFYPHSLQLNSNKFPGIDPEDCNPSLHNLKTTSYCLFRNARLTEYKQHWWWKTNFVFESMPTIRVIKSPIIFLEEDNYVLPDLLHVFHYAKRTFQYFPQVEVLSLGTSFATKQHMDLLILEPWLPRYSIGLAFNRSTWNKILPLSAHYCMYNDNNWSYSMLNLFHNFPRGFVSMIRSMAPRVLSSKQLESLNSVNIVSERLAEHLFPNKMQAVFFFGGNGLVQNPPKSYPRGNGGWNDLRDQVLCLDPLLSTTTEESRYYDEYATYIDKTSKRLYSSNNLTQRKKVVINKQFINNH